jgi:cytochrome c
MLGGIALAMTACGPSTSTTSSTTPTTTTSSSTAPATSAGGEAAPTTFASQVAQGQTLYAEHCASCHGDSGQGTSHGPRVVGLAQGALPLAPRQGSQRTTQFVTVADVGTFAATHMPPDHPGSLSADQYWAILAFDLHANGVDLPKPIDGSNAKDVVLHK